LENLEDPVRGGCHLKEGRICGEDGEGFCEDGRNKVCLLLVVLNSRADAGQELDEVDPLRREYLVAR